jgi:Universal stress protein UspA and related nucleotide-binding proteins
MKVLIAINETSYADAIADFVTTHHWEPDTEFTLMTVVEPLKVGSMMAVLPGPILDETVAKQKENAERVLAAFVQSISQTVSEERIKRIILEGFPSDEIMKEVLVSKSNMLVVGSHGRHGIERIVLGSVSLFLVSHAPCSVVVIRPARKQEELNKPSLAKVSSHK